MPHHHNEGTTVHPNLLSITIETEFEPKAAASVIRVALAPLGTVKEVKVIVAETSDVPGGDEIEATSKQ